eukprot:156905-Chlamydomonas_euryale.AAC.2
MPAAPTKGSPQRACCTNKGLAALTACPLHQQRARRTDSVPAAPTKGSPHQGRMRGSKAVSLQSSGLKRTSSVLPPSPS